MNSYPAEDLTGETCNSKNASTMRKIASPTCIFAGIGHYCSTMFNWSDLRYFLEAHRAGNMAAAGRRLGVDQTTVTRRIQALEQSIGTQLLDQTSIGYKLTAAGSKLLRHAEAMESIGIEIEGEIAGRDYAISGIVRIGVTEGLGSYFLSRYLPAFNDKLPDVGVDLISIPRFVDLANREADIAIGQERPSASRLVISKLTDYNLKLYASPGYLASHPPIQSRKDLDGHDFIGYVDDLLYSRELRYLANVCRAPRMVFRSTSIVAQHQASIAGAGIAILPCFMVQPDLGLEVVLPAEVQLTLTYWITTRSELLRLARVRAAWDFLKTLVEQRQDCFTRGSTS
jgi:DNA-binding transcriptional LysR family regulator